jgi:hypothetical protein
MEKDTETEQRIRERAYQIWIEEGRPTGRDKEHWARAEQELSETTGEARRSNQTSLSVK